MKLQDLSPHFDGLHSAFKDLAQSNDTPKGMRSCLLQAAAHAGDIADALEELEEPLPEPADKIQKTAQEFWRSLPGNKMDAFDRFADDLIRSAGDTPKSSDYDPGF
jgi:hypothetical protein